ncbi:bifunctional adenosylcobinamide kinase/adenosylcobinamide-phosphate guanylyltransferase [Neobacillus soli]|uniref:bifunctional adenosylcobinamide kinase/adenosylcobinamide-phosphate guanylyltransferase n=1 Tax=Neobacillus soli TaxID=220688 RepID=UPI0008241453|nr:bifunctional adenosylcobinamide kinase/adenosylcobinamide-phosphate guanylyltransferase [Neobacillus soli]
MHFITGGAFNGKRAWVKNRYKVQSDDQWLSAYVNNPLPLIIMEIDQDVFILEGAELWLRALTENYDADKCREIWNECLENWLTWEKERQNRQLIVIGTDITKGIVPMEAENRLWRDVTGWAYQDIAAKSEKVDVIWYGVHQTIK